MECQPGRIGDVAFEHGRDLSQRVVVVGGRIRHDAVGRSEQLEIAHVGIVGGEEGADVARDPVTIRQAAAQPGTSIAIL